MAALSFPLAQATFGDTLLTIAAADPWQLMPMQELSGLGSGELLAADLGPMLWEAGFVLAPLPATEARAKMAVLNALDGAINSLYLSNPLACWPAADPGGALLSGYTPTIASINADRKRLAFTGLPPGYALSAGDFFHVDYGSARRALIQLVGSATADGSGDTAEVEVRPHLRAGIATDSPVAFARPAAKGILVPGSLTQRAQGNRVTISFRFRQTLAAD